MEPVPALFPAQVPPERRLVLGEMNGQKYLWQKIQNMPLLGIISLLRLSSVLPPQLLKAENFVAFKVSDFVPEALGAQDGTTPQMASFPFCEQTGPLGTGFGVTPEGFPGWNF